MYENLVEIWTYLLLVAIGCMAGFINVVAGGGSLLTMPVMIFLGMSPALANGTNRIALLAQNITAVSTFKSRGFSSFKKSLFLALCTIPGATLGAFAAIRIDPDWFKRLLALVMIVVLILMLTKKKKKGSDQDQESQDVGTLRKVSAYLGMVGVGFYGGFIQAGVGFILMAILHRLLHLDLIRVNMHKVFIVGVYMIPSLVIFAVLEQVNWIAGALLAVGNATGAWIGTRLQISRGESVVRVIFSLAVVALVIKLLLESW